VDLITIQAVHFDWGVSYLILCLEEYQKTNDASSKICLPHNAITQVGPEVNRDKIKYMFMSGLLGKRGKVQIFGGYRNKSIFHSGSD
jgi:hypothetical protein